MDGEAKYEIVRDPAVIAAYVRKRQIIDEETTLADTLAPTGDAEKDARAKKRYVVRAFCFAGSRRGWWGSRRARRAF